MCVYNIDIDIVSYVMFAKAPYIALLFVISDTFSKPNVALLLGIFSKADVAH